MKMKLPLEMGGLRASVFTVKNRATRLAIAQTKRRAMGETISQTAGNVAVVAVISSHFVENATNARNKDTKGLTAQRKQAMVMQATTATQQVEPTINKRVR